MWVLAPPIIWTIVAGPSNNSDLGTALLRITLQVVMSLYHCALLGDPWVVLGKSFIEPYEFLFSFEGGY